MIAYWTGPTPAWQKTELFAAVGALGFAALEWMDAGHRLIDDSGKRYLAVEGEGGAPPRFVLYELHARELVCVAETSADGAVRYFEITEKGREALVLPREQKWA